MDITSNSWHVLTKARNGTVSLIRNLSLAGAGQIYESLNPHRGHVSGQMYHCQDGDIEQREVLGPDGWDGCMKAWAHDYQDIKEIVTDGGPNKGRRYRTGQCAHCKSMLFKWCDQAAA